jgi:hypothetical protein
MRSTSDMTRRAVLLGGAGSIGFAGTAWAQAPRPTRAKLLRMVSKAFADPQPMRFSRPQIIGFQGELVTRQVGYRSGDVIHYFAVADPRRADDLVFFTQDQGAKIFRMHRTGMHLNRVASAINDQNRSDGLIVWAGPECDNDFASQLAYWAQRNI